MAARMARSIFPIRSASSSILSKRLFSSVASKRPPLPWFSRSTSSPESFRVVVPGATLLNDLQCRVNQSASLTYSSFREGISEKTLQSFGVDFKHWLVAISNPGGEGATKEKVIDDCVKTLAKVLGSEEEARKKIYSVSFDGYFGFGSEVDEETAEKLKGVPGVLFVMPDFYADAETKDFGGEPFVNGKLADSSRKARNQDAQVKTEMLKLIHEAYTKLEGRTMETGPEAQLASPR